MKKLLLPLLLAAALTLTLAACGAGANKNETSAVTNTTAVATTAAPTASRTDPAAETAVSRTDVDTTAATKPQKENKTTAPPIKTTAPESTAEKTVLFSDDADNAFIKTVAKKYNADASLLAAIYYVPQSDSNVVLQFDGTRDENGKPVRNGDTLKYIYTVNASYSVKKRASENPLENEGCSVGESIQMFFTVKKWLIPKFETELS